MIADIFYSWLVTSILPVVESGRVDSGGNRRSANRSAGQTKPTIPDNDDSFTGSFGGAKEVGGLIWIHSLPDFVQMYYVEDKVWKSFYFYFNFIFKFICSFTTLYIQYLVQYITNLYYNVFWLCTLHYTVY